jgi:hypothetical protein
MENNLINNNIHNNTNNNHKHNYFNLLLSNFGIVFFSLSLALCYISAHMKSRPNPFVVATEQDIENVERCPICLKELEEDDNLRFKVCTHILCIECGNNLIKNHINTCPVCRRNIYENIIEV